MTKVEYLIVGDTDKMDGWMLIRMDTDKMDV